MSIKKLLIIIFIPFFAFANSAEVFKGEVVEVVHEEKVQIPELNLETFYQDLKIKIIDDNNTEKIIDLKNDYIKLRKGDRVFVENVRNSTEKQDTFIVKERDRTNTLIYFLVIFVLAIIFFGGMQGIRSVLSLFLSFIAIGYILIPAIMNGYSPVLVSGVVATIILFMAIYFTHGLNRESTSAFLGTVISVFLTGILAYLGVKIAQFTGLGTEESMMLSLHGEISMDFAGLLLGGIIIGALGVLDDVAVTQSIVVREIYKLQKDMEFLEVYKRAISVGREHVGAMVNTLALAYTGASLPLILIFYKSDYPISLILSQEIFSVEIMRTIVGSIGLILSVPLTTAFAVYLLRNRI